MNDYPSQKELTVPAAKVQLYSILVAIVVFLALSLPFQYLYGTPIFRFEEINLQKAILIGIIFFVGTAVHELIHGLTAIFYAGIRAADARFGFQWKSLTPYFHSKVPIAAGKYRVVVMMPLLVMGLIPYLVGMLVGNGWIVAAGILFIVAAGGDLLILWLMRDVQSRTPVRDHPEKVGLIIPE
jgi:hypothetical protein